MRPFLSLYITNFFLVLGTGLLTTYLALYMEQKGESTFWIGALTSCYYLGLLLGARIGFFLIRSVGHIRSFAASTAIVTSCVAAHGISDDIYLWLVLRLIVGLGMMCNYMVLESWLNEQTQAEQRGKVFSFYMITSYLGMVAGQLALSQFMQLGYAALFMVCIAVSIGIVPIATTQRIHPKKLKPLQVSVFGFLRIIPQSLTAIFFAGMINGSFYGLAPIFANQTGFNAEDIAQFMSLTVLAGLLAQWPMGALSDKVSRSRLLRINAVIIGLICLALCLLPTEKTWTFPLTFCFGFFAFTLYPLASALANSRVDDDDRVGVSSALLVAFGGGAVLGSALLAQSMAYFGPSALYGSITLLTGIMFSLLVLINSKQKAEKMNAHDYVVSASDVTTSPLAATLDPRIEESLAQEQLLEEEDESDFDEETHQPKDMHNSSHGEHDIDHKDLAK